MKNNLFRHIPPFSPRNRSRPSARRSMCVSNGSSRAARLPARLLVRSGVARVRPAGEWPCPTGLRRRHPSVELEPGDWLDIKAHARHRVEWTDPEQDTVWLAAHYR